MLFNLLLFFIAPADAVLSVVRSAISSCGDLQTPRDIARILACSIVNVTSWTYDL